MTLFKNRKEAGAELAKRLAPYKNHPKGIVIGLPRGGVVLAAEVAKALSLPLDVVCPRKIGAPINPEFAIGAITETGEGIFDSQAIKYMGVTDDYIESKVAEEKEQAMRRLSLFRKGMPARDLKDKVVLIVDDGLATGSTMKAAIQSIKSEGADKVVAAVPVSPVDTLEEVTEMVDEIVCIAAPPFFQAVGQFYDNFSETTDDDVIEIMNAFS